MELELSCVLKVPDCIHFPVLKTLTLAFMTFVDKASVQELFSGCPVLQELTLEDCSWKNVRNINIKIPTVTTLEIRDFYCRDGIVNRKVTIDAESLRSLTFSHDLFIEFIPAGLTSLADAYVNVSHMNSSLREYTIRRALKIFSGIFQVKSLELSNGSLETLSKAENLLSSLPTFHNLTYLSVDLEMYDESNAETLMDILEKSPKLEDLHIGFDARYHPDGKVLKLRPVPHCMKYSLKFVRITNFWGRIAEMELLIFLLKNATMLSRIMVSSGESLSTDLKKQAEINNQVQVARNGLPSCAIEFQRS